MTSLSVVVPGVEPIQWVRVQKKSRVVYVAGSGRRILQRWPMAETGRLLLKLICGKCTTYSREWLLLVLWLFSLLVISNRGNESHFLSTILKKAN